MFIYLFIYFKHLDLDGLEESIIINGNCLDSNIGKMYDLMVQLIQETNFDNTDKLKTLIKSVNAK